MPPYHSTRDTLGVSVRQAAAVHYPRAISLRSANNCHCQRSASNAENIASAIQEGAMVGAGPPRIAVPASPAPPSVRSPAGAASAG